MSVSTTLVVAGALAAAALLGSFEWRARSNIVTVGFWFEDTVTYDVHDPARLGGPLSVPEQARLRDVAREEVARAFAGFRIAVTDRRDAFYRVGVQQVIVSEGRGSRRWSGAAGQSNVFGPLGGYGRVSFYVLASQALTYAPPGATRADIVDAIGRGIGRSAVHEFTHQILPSQAIHATRDAASYEYWSSNRAVQYYGEMHWSVARDSLLKRLGH